MRPNVHLDSALDSQFVSVSGSTYAVAGSNVPNDRNQSQIFTSILQSVNSYLKNSVTFNVSPNDTTKLTVPLIQVSQACTESELYFEVQSMFLFPVIWLLYLPTVSSTVPVILIPADPNRLNEARSSSIIAAPTVT